MKLSRRKTDHGKHGDEGRFVAGLQGVLVQAGSKRRATRRSRILRLGASLGV
jgi:hypothetical protein